MSHRLRVLTGIFTVALLGIMAGACGGGGTTASSSSRRQVSTPTSAAAPGAAASTVGAGAPGGSSSAAAASGATQQLASVDQLLGQADTAAAQTNVDQGQEGTAP
jgi:hypothetical protein